MKSIAVIPIILVLAALVLILNPINLFTASIYSGSGFDVTAISQTKIISNDADLNSANFIIETSTNGGGQYIVDTTEFEQELSKSGPLTVDIKYPLKIEMGQIQETLNYDISNIGSIDKFTKSYSDIVEQNLFMSGEELIKQTLAKCEDATWCIPTKVRDGSFGWPKYNYAQWRALKVYNPSIGSRGELALSKIGWSGTASITINGKVYSKEMGDGTVAVDFIDDNGNWIGQASWVGSLITGDIIPEHRLYIGTFLQNSNNWMISNKNPYYESYLNSLSQTKTSFGVYNKQKDICLEYPCNKVENLINTHNNNVDTLTSQSSIVSYVSATSTNSLTSSHTSGTSTSGKLTESIDRKITRPVIVWKIKASSLAVVIPVGKPQIVSIDSPSFASGDNDGQTIVTIKNIGSGAGTFAATFTELSNTFSPSTTAQSSQITLSPGATGKITLYISHGTTATDIKKTASVRVYDVNKPSNEAVMNFDITMTPPKACTPNTYDTRGNSVYKCRADGSGYDLVFNCDNGIIEWINGVPSCKITNNVTPPEDETKSDGTYFEILLKSWLSSPLLIALLIVLALIGISIFKQTKRRKT